MLVCDSTTKAFRKSHIFSHSGAEAVKVRMTSSVLLKKELGKDGTKLCE